jgi:exodeoxyribonuclease-5
MTGKKFLTDRLSPQQVSALQALMEDGVQRGVMRRYDRPLDNVLWRYDGASADVIVICYNARRKKRDHSLVIEHCDDVGPLVREGRWDDLEKHLADRKEAEAKAQADGRFRGPLSWLTLLPEVEAQAAASGPVLRRRSDLSPHQAGVYDAVLGWVREPSTQVLTLGGYAGTGKSTLIATLAAELADLSVAFSAPTGKAALVLRQKLRLAGVDLSGRYCGTIHRLIYRPKIDRRTGRYRGVELADSLDCDLLVVDEASMVDDDVYRDLRSFHVPILAIGDHGQLPPVEGHLNLMEAPDLRLTEIHRQAHGNPIIRLSAEIRAGASPMEGDSQDPRLRRVRVKTREDVEKLLGRLIQTPAAAWETAVLCYTNRARVWLNRIVRRILGIEGDLASGDVVVCLKNAYFERHLLANGTRGIVEEVKDDEPAEFHVHARIRHPDDGYLVDGRVLRQQLGGEKTLEAYDRLGFDVERWEDVGLLYDHGYALTVHKSQGSQFRRVVLVLERPGPVSESSWRRWLYTGVTRAVEELVLVERE